MAQITTYFTSSSGGGISGSGAAGEVAFFTAATVLDSGSNLAWDDTNRRLSLNGPNTVGSTLVIAGDGYTDATSAIDVRTSLTYGDIMVFKVYDNGRIDSQVLSGTGSGGRKNVSIGIDAGLNISSGQQNTLIGEFAGSAISTGSSNTYIGALAGSSSSGSGNSGSDNTVVGYGSLRTTGSSSSNTVVGSNSGVLGASNQSIVPSTCVYVGQSIKSGNTSGTVSNEIVIGQGVVGAGDNTTTIGNSSCVSCFISGNVVPELGMTIPDGTNITFDDGTGTKIGTSAAEKFAFWNATPKVQPATGNITAAAYFHVNSNAIHINDTFGGYTLAQVVGALQQIGILA
jgi:hypothetical protein